MKIFALLLLLIFIVIAVFTVLNWEVLITVTPLFLGVAEVEAPLGLVMLGLLVILGAFFIFALGYQKTEAIFRDRRHARELQTTQELAAKAEASRITELREFLTEELARQDKQTTETSAELIARMDQLADELLNRLSEELARREQQTTETSAELMARMDQLADEVLSAQAESGRTAGASAKGALTANLGEQAARRKEEYQRKLEAQLAEWSAEIEQLKEKADQAGADLKDEYLEQIENLRARQQDARENLAQLKEAGDDAWEELKAGANRAWEALGQALQAARDKFK
jgi:uncharacterized integral membrane protein